MEDFISTRVSKIKDDAVKQFQSISYEVPKKKSRRNVRETEEKDERHEENNDVDEKKKQELEMKRIRYEVMKFGMSGFEKTKANEAKVALAISLGAKPPKNKGVNYKALKLQKEKEKELQKSGQRVSGLENSMLKQKKPKTNRKKKSQGILGVYGKVNKNRK